MAKVFKQIIQRTGDGTSDPVILPEETEESNNRRISMSVKFLGGGAAKFQVTNADPINLSSSNTVWQDWDLGSVSVDTIDWTEAPITAIRCVSSSGGTNTQFTIRAVE